MDNKGKGVICKIVPDDEMPVDENGVKVDIMVDPNTTVSRMNLGRLDESYVNSASRDATVKLRRMFGVTGEEKDLYERLKVTDKALFNNAWDFLMGYYSLITPRQTKMLNSDEYTQRVMEKHGKDGREFHMAEVLKNGIYLYIPTDNEPEYDSYIKAIEASDLYRPTYGKIKFKNPDGSYTYSKRNVRVSSMYMLLLEKTGNDWSANATGKVQQHGILAPLSSSDKNSTPARQQPSRVFDEAAVRGMVAYMDPMMTEDILDRNSNPEVHREIVRNILAAPEPTNIDVIVDRKKFPLGHSKPLQIVKHMAYCNGYKFNWKHMATTEPTYQLRKENIIKKDGE